jgi:hypothetical protein
MSWLFSQALVAEYLGGNFSDGEPSAPSNGNPTQLAYLPPDKTTAFSRLSRFGMTFKPLTADRGEELLTSYRAAFHVKTSVPQEKATDLTEKDQECGDTWRGWLAKFDPDTSSWKTAQCSLLEDSIESLQTLPRSGMTRGGLLWELPMLERRTNAKEFGLLPTPVASDSKGQTKNTIQYKNKRFVRVSQTTGTEFGARLSGAYHLMTGNILPTSFSEWMMGWPLGWTDLKPLETDKSHCAQQQHGTT